MGLIKWEPLNDIEAMVDRAMNWPFPRLASNLTMAEWGPRVDICESDGTYLFKARQDVAVSLAGDMLTIQGERKRESEEKKPHFHRVERSYGSFSRSFSLPEDADPATIHAHCENGELTISIAKKAGAASSENVSVPVE
ncbi:MAG: Hsp20/alpha crystallin family protein [Vulcanococcus sp.]